MLDKLKDLDLRYEDLEAQLGGSPCVYGDAERLTSGKPGAEGADCRWRRRTGHTRQAEADRRRAAEELLS